MTLRVALDELLPAKAAARELPQALDRLERGEVEQLVITRRNEPRAALVSVERYEELLLIEKTHRNGDANGNGVETSVAIAAPTR
jgi:prevent-host-death family protein